MEGGRFHAALTVLHKEESPENSDESPPSPMSTTFYDTKATSTSSSPKRSGRRRGTQKRVVQLVPIINKEVDQAGCSHRLNKVESTRVNYNNNNNTPPSDSWAWRKYGQKPIKGSPYPRGYYRCSSSKGCPARKQVERSRTDPTMVMVTYSCEHNHNHPWPAASSASSSRNMNHHHHSNPTASPPATEPSTSNTDEYQLEEEEEEEPTLIIQTTTQTSTEAATHEHDEDQKFTSSSLDEVGGSFVDQNQYGTWFSDLDSSCTSSTTCMLESPLLGLEESDMATIFSIREDEEESFFADLGELPECTTVFRRSAGIQSVEDHRRNLAPPWCTAGPQPQAG